jgi:hypothetical protein
MSRYGYRLAVHRLGFERQNQTLFQNLQHNQHLDSDHFQRLGFLEDLARLGFLLFSVYRLANVIFSLKSVPIM